MATLTFDAVIYGGTMAGIIAAKRIAMAGYTVCILEWTKFTGGLVTGGLGIPDYVGGGASSTDWGLTTAYFQRLEAFAILDGATEELYGRHPNGLIRRYIPSWAVSARDEMLEDDNITVVTDIELMAVEKDPLTKRILSVTLDDGNTYAAGQFADASYEGDLLRMAGVTMTYGREGRAAYDEYNAGVVRWNALSNPSQRRVSARGDVWKDYTFPPTVPDGQADYKTQAYNFRMTLSTESDRRVFAPPPGFRREDFLDFIDESNVRGFSTIEAITSYQSPTPFLHSTNGNDWPGKAWEYPRLRTKAERIRHTDEMFCRHAGQYWVAQQDSAVPSDLRTSVAAHGLPAHENSVEYIGTPGWSSALYARVCTRMIGQQVMNFNDMTEPRRTQKTDPIGVIGYGVDRHSIHYYPTPEGGFMNEGGPEDVGRGYSQVPFGSLKPVTGQCSNALALVPVSCTDIVMCSYRMEPSWMITGDAGGLAIAEAIKRDIPVATLSYGPLREALQDAGAKLTP